MKVLYRRNSLILAIACATVGLAGQAIDKPLFAQAAAPANPTAPVGQTNGLTFPARPPLPPLPSTTGRTLIKNRVPPPQAPGSVVIGPVVPGAPPVATVPPVATAPPAVAAPSPSPAYAPVVVPNTVLAWDAEKKQYLAKPTEVNAHFAFYLTNVSSAEVMINGVRTSCGCTAAKLPQTPWRIAPGESGPIEVNMNIAGKRGIIAKSVTVDTSAGMKYLTVESHIADLSSGTNIVGMSDRDRNQMLAKADPLAIFKGDCAKCHVEPTVGKMGRDLYASACSICHNAEHRAAMVPDLQDKYRTPMPSEFWRLFITLGKPGTLMPTFARENGGILTQEQVASLVDYLVSDFPKEAKMVYHDPHGPSAPVPVAAPARQTPITNAPSAALPKSASLPPNVSVFPVQKVP